MSKILIDKSGQSGELKIPKDKNDLAARVRKVNYKEPKTLKTFLQPIEPNLERTPFIQLKQVGLLSAEQSRLQMEQAIQDELKKALELKLELKGKEKDEYDKYIRSLPTPNRINTILNLFKGDAINSLKSVLRETKEVQLQKKQAVTKEKAEIQKEAKKAENISKRIAEKLKETEPKVTTEKGRKRPAKEIEQGRPIKK